MLIHQTQASPGRGCHLELVSWTWTIVSVETGRLEPLELSPVFGTNIGVPCDGVHCPPSREISYPQFHHDCPTFPPPCNHWYIASWLPWLPGSQNLFVVGVESILWVPFLFLMDLLVGRSLATPYKPTQSLHHGPIWQHPAYGSPSPSAQSSPFSLSPTR